MLSHGVLPGVRPEEAARRSRLLLLAAQRAAVSQIPQRRSAQRQRCNQRTQTTHAVPTADDISTNEISDDDSMYMPAFARGSAIRFTTEGHPIIRQGKRDYVLHPEQPGRADPRPIKQPYRAGYLPPAPAGQPPRRIHWLVPAGAAVLVLLSLLVIGNWIIGAWQAHQLDAQYGMPRTYQIDAVVGHNNDSTEHPSHFNFQNLQGKIVITEFPAGDASKAIVYTGPVLSGPDAAKVPVTGDFQDTSGDGRPDLVMHIGDQTLVYLNNGAKFVPQG